MEFLERIQSNLESRLQSAMQISVKEVQEYARQNHNFKTRTGEAERSITSSVSGSGGHWEGIVGTNREITVYLHEGTKERIITPTHKMALRWTAGGRFIFAKRVNHPGTLADRFITNALQEKKEDIINRFDKSVSVAFKV
ncbi:hypothetical protein [Veillonella criceti]|uniref:Phage protein, HK97 gp10 family n=1 Tax=Veillonella criceti TaxID=103891 RepID=A0A380NJ67_9FIRM|nr:hypothetical protein [Veillonella criceti]SUP42253.1 Uncharacterised protein [Veillonella criceti]